MPIVSMKDMLIEAKKGKYAVGQYNMNNLEWAGGILMAAEEAQSPVIIGVSEGAARYMGGFKVCVNIVTALVETYKITVPVAIHLDHGSSFEACKNAIDAGFTSVMIDFSHHSLAENISETKKVVDYAHARGASVEAELGIVGGQEDDVVGEVMYANPAECKRLVEESKIDCLAPALGSVHGPYKGEPKLGFAEMEEISKLVNVPLVLHGGSGIPLHQIQKAISLGSAKINVNTECQITATKAVREFLDKNPNEYDPRRYLGPLREAVKKTVLEKINDFGTKGKA